ncbi:MAG: carbamate kinase [Euryarchaeota archaeon]|nr:carbamate kinase [Euryarchaeota archaeon]
MNLGRRLVIAIGGNAILQEGQRGTAEEQRANLEVACESLAALIRPGVNVVLTHGNGPQVGNILVQNEAARAQVPALPLDVCGAQSQGSLGYLIQQVLSGVLRSRNIRRDVMALVTQTVVSPDDPAFLSPSKPIGPYYREPEARALSQEKGWKLVEVGKRHWRRVVASPDPLEIVEKGMIRKLMRQGTVVIAAGGGGIPVVRRDGRLAGVEAVVDKDLASATLARDVGADAMILLTDIEKVAINFRTPEERFLDRMTVEEAGRYLKAGHFPAGSMGPKIEAAIRFLAPRPEPTLDSFGAPGARFSRPQLKVIIASLNAAERAARGKTGTTITPD